MLLHARGLTVTRPGDAGPVPVLRGVDVDVAGGTLTDLSGPSGCGKTTLLLALARLLPGVAGELSLDGVPASQVDPRAWRTRVAYLPQRASLVAGAVGENLLAPWRLAVRRDLEPPSRGTLERALAGVGMEDVALDRDASRLSVGQYARVALLRVVLSGPEALLLDEPDASLDDESAAQVARMTREFVAGGGAVVRVRHARADAQADFRLRLHDGLLSEVGSRA
jgi:putative ABC transport system ATP-binding protein